jgi:MarR family transcriptional regulator, organic hydroperoxide resistance regulator
LTRSSRKPRKTPAPQQALALKALKQFRLIYGSVRAHFRSIEEACGVSGSQLWVLHEVRRTPGIGVSELATTLSIQQATCSQLVEKLVTRKLLAKNRSATDQRRVVLTLTASANKVLASAPGPAEGVLPEALMRLPARRLELLSRELQHVVTELKLADERAADRPLADL